MKQKISILGSTGSIGRQALEVIDNLEGMFEIYALAVGQNIESFVLKKKKNSQKVFSFNQFAIMIALIIKQKVAFPNLAE